MSTTTPTPERCRSCQAPVLWARHTATGRWAPFDAEPSTAGNVVLDGDQATVVGPPSLFDAPDERPRYMPHHATCPHAAAWRRGR